MHLGMKITPTVTLANNGITYIFDSTAGLTQTPAATAGTYRGRYAGNRIVGNLKPTTQDVTLRMDYLNTAGTWDTGISSTAVTAGNTQDFDLLPRSPDYRVVIVNGATGPSALYAEAAIVSGDRSAGS